MATTPNNTGTISVPLSSILDALGGNLSEVERATLFQRLIGFRINEVRPGDLIEAKLFNQMLTDINDLALRVARLEAGDVEPAGPIIDRLDPATAVDVEGRLTVVGRNFNPEPRFNVVRIGDVDITQFRTDSTSTHLVFMVPDRFTGLPKEFPVRVETGGRTSPAVPITIREQTRVQEGNFEFGTATVTTNPPGDIQEGSTVTLSWAILARTRYDDNVTLSALVVDPQGVNGQVWSTNLTVHPGPTMLIPWGQTRTASISVRVPTGGTSVQLGMRAVSQGLQVANVSDLVTVATGDPPETSSPDIALTVDIGGGAVDAGSFDVDGESVDGFVVTAGGSGDLAFTARDTRAPGAAAATFQYAAEFEGPDNGLKVVAGPVPASDTCTAGGHRNFSVTLSTAPGAAVNATARLKVTCRQTNPSLGTYKAFRSIYLKIVN